MTAVHDEVNQRLGLIPNFFRLEPENPEITENLWAFARFGYLDNPLPSLFKERLFVWLSRFCEARYSVARHVGFLVGLGRISGDASCRPQSVNDMLRLLKRPVPREAECRTHIERCAVLDKPLAELPPPDSELERSIFACATHVFLQSPIELDCLDALQRALGSSRMEHLLVLLAFVRTSHYWTRVHPELTFEDDIRHLLATHQQLSQCVLDDPEAGPGETGQRLLAELDTLRHEKQQILHDSEIRLEQNLADSRLLHDISNELVGEHDGHALYGKIVDAASRLMRSPFASMQELRTDGDGNTELQLLGHRGFIPEAVRFWDRVRIDSASSCGAALASGQRIVVADVERCEFMEGTEDQAMYRKTGIRAVQTTPLYSRTGALVGAISTHWHDPHAPSEHELQLLDILARQAADLIERAKSEEALRASEERFRRALQPRHVGVIFFDAEGRITEANDAFLRMSGYARGDVEAGRLRWNEMTPPEWMDVSLRADNELKTKGYTTPYEKEYIRKDGSRWWGLFAGTRLADNESVEYIIDISDQKRAERALRESEARFRALADASPALIWQIDPQGNAVYLNQRYLDITGMMPEQLLAVGWHSIVHPADLPGYLAVVNTALHQQTAYQSRARARVRDGNWHWFESYAAPYFSITGEFCGHVGISIDITETIQAEEALRETSRRKDEFIATLAHELRNPLAPIGNAVLLLKRKADPQAAGRLIDMVERQVSQMVRLVDDLLEVSRITRGRVELRKAPVDLADIVHGAVETSKPSIDGARHRLTVSLPEEPLILEADKIRLIQAFANLLNNAAKYTNEGGHIALAARREGRQAEVSVRDSGLGIPGDMLAQIFDMFTQAHRSCGRGEGGLGIGLTMVRSLVELHGGTIEANSEGPGTGSEFIVRLPLLEDLSESGEQGAGVGWNGSMPLSGQRILVVDDNRDAAESLAMLLELDGADTRIAYDGVAALEALNTYCPHAAVIDIGMPGISGHDLAKRIREHPRHAGIRLFALTGWGQEDDRIRSRASGFDQHLTKPVDVEALKVLLIMR